MIELKQDQELAHEKIRLWLQRPVGGMFLLQGAAGTGKSFLTKTIISEYLVTSRKRVLITAPTHKALKVLETMNPSHDSDRVKFCTTHAALGLKEHIDGFGKVTYKNDSGVCPLYDYQMIVVDEASMLHDELFFDLYSHVKRGVKVLYVGDFYQIPPVNNTKSIPFDKDARERYSIDSFTLEQIIRQKEGSPILNIAHKIKNNIFKPVAIIDIKDEVTSSGEVRSFSRANETEAYELINSIFTSDQYRSDPDYAKIIAWRNETVGEYNRMIRAKIYGADLAKIVVGDRLIFKSPWTEEEKILIPTNSEVEVLSCEEDIFEVDAGFTLKVYNTVVKVFNSQSAYDKIMIRVIHEDSGADLKYVLDLLKNEALSHPQGSYSARSAWIDYYSFMRIFAEIDYSHAITCHRSQGSTYKNAIVMHWDIERNRRVNEKNRILYTACTRPSERLVIIS